MSADVLRRAAVQMRERSEAATAGPWAEWHMVEDGRCEMFVPNGTMSTETVLEFKDYADCEECARPSEADVAYISWMHPAVALAVADLLDVWVDRDLLSSSGTLADERSAILAVASTYLGVSA